MRKRYNRIYIVGSVASGKALLAQELSKRLGIIWYELDNIIWERHPGRNIKRTPQQRDEVFNQITLSEKWIIEDVLRPCFESGLKKADLIVLLDLPVRKGWMAAFGWIKDLFQLKKSKRNPAVQAFKSGGSSLNFKRNIPAFMKRLEPYKDKVIVLRDQNDIRNLYEELTEN